MFVYQIINKVNQKTYVGKTKRKLSVRFSQHKHQAFKQNKQTYLHRAIRKYGIENFELKILEKIVDINLLNEKEKYWIQKISPEYNMTEGGEGVLGYKFSKELKKYLSDIKKGIKFSEEHRRNLSICNKGERNPMYGRCGNLNPFYGKKHSDEFIEKKSKEYCFYAPTGEKIYIKNLTKYCRENNLHTGNMCSLYYGKIKSYKGYTKII
jgi:group I intron endonuclease